MAAMAAFLPSIIGAVASVALTSMLKKDEPPAPQPIPQAAAAPVAPVEPPKVEEPTPMPAPNDAVRRAAAKRSIAQQMARRGRASTVLTDDADAKLGG